jgi:hypothetical protein
MTKKEAQLMGFMDHESPVHGTCYMNLIGGLPMIIRKDNETNDWYLTIDISSCQVKYYNFSEAQGFLNNLQRHSNG